MLKEAIFIGIPFIIMAILSIICSLDDIKMLEKKQKLNSSNEDGKDEKCIANENNNNEDLKNFFSKKTYKWFLKTSIPFCCIIVLASTILISIALNIFFGMIWFGLCCLTLILYFWFFSKIFKN